MRCWTTCAAACPKARHAVPSVSAHFVPVALCAFSHAPLSSCASLRAADACVRQILFNALGLIHHGLKAEAAWTTGHLESQLKFNNGQLLDGVAAVLSFYPRTLLQVHIAPPEDVMRLPSHVAAALGADRAMPEGVSNDEAARNGCRRLAKWRAETVASAIVQLGVPTQRVAATAPGHDEGMQAAGQFTLHKLPEQLRVAAAAAESSGGGTDPRHWVVGEGPLTRDELSGSEAALVDLRRRRVEVLEATRTELHELHAYAANYAPMRLPRPMTLIVSVVEVSLPSTTPHVMIAFGSERVVDRVAAFQMHDVCIDKVDIELWSGAEEKVGGALTHLVGACVIGVGELLASDGLPAIAASLPVGTSGGLATGNVRVTVEARGTRRLKFF